MALSPERMREEEEEGQQEYILRWREHNPQIVNQVRSSQQSQRSVLSLVVPGNVEGGEFH